jgi:hypothetical protein
VTDAPPFDPASFVERAPWRYARTMPQWPHEYVVIGDGLDGGERFASHVRIAGRVEDLGFGAQLYLELGGWRYWVTWPCINRERVE